MPVPQLIRDAFEVLARADQDALVQLAAMRTLRGWLGEREQATLAAARAQDYTWEQIGAAQARPRQAVQRQASRARQPRVLGLTGPDFEGVATSELHFWLHWWARWTAERPEDAHRDPSHEQHKIRAELKARQRPPPAHPDRHTAP